MSIMPSPECTKPNLMSLLATLARLNLVSMCVLLTTSFWLRPHLHCSQRLFRIAVSIDQAFCVPAYLVHSVLVYSPKQDTASSRFFHFHFVTGYYCAY